MPATREEYNEVVKHPGKFEGEEAYVPYFWDVYLDGGADSDDGKVLSFVVTEDDRKLFPELALGSIIKLVERSDGFVLEVWACPR